MIYFKQLFFLCLLISLSGNILAQSQEEFSLKFTEIYTLSATDTKKAKEQAEALLKMVEGKKDLQTYTNYYMLTTIFENQVPNQELATQCKEKANLEMQKMMNNPAAVTVSSDDPVSKWNGSYMPSLFTTNDPNNANRAEAFLEKYDALKSFNNYAYLGYAHERNSDFKKAKACYEKGIRYVGNDREVFHPYSYYANYLSRSGDYLKAEEYIHKMTLLADEANEYIKIAYRADALTSKMIYFLSVGDFYNYTLTANEQYDYLASIANKNGIGCDIYSNPRYTVTAYASESLKEFAKAEILWLKRDSAATEWINCMNTKYPSQKQLPLSMSPVYLIKRGKKSLLKKPVAFYIEEAETHYKSYEKYADMSINFMRAEHLGFLGAPQYHPLFKSVMQQIEVSKDFRASTTPFTSYAYFTMRDRQLELSKTTYEKLFQLNITWINDIIFSFGEKAFVTYYNARLKDGYDNFHSFVKISQTTAPSLYGSLTSQAYDNLLFTKSLSLKGSQKRKQAFLKSNDPVIKQLYETWMDKKQELIRLYRKTEEPSEDVKNSIDQLQLKKLQEEVNHLENELTNKATDFQKYLKISTTSWKSIRERLKEGEVAIEMVRFNWRDQVYYSDTAYYAAYFITKNSSYPEVVYLPDFAKDLENRYYKLYQNNIKFKLKDTTLYQHFWKPIQDKLKGAKKIYFSPDGIYHLINLSTLFNPASGKYLLEETDLHYTTSSADIQIGLSSFNIKNAALIGRPTYKMEDSKTPLVAVADQNTRSFVRDFRGNTISDLPGTETEVINIKKEMDQRAIQVKLLLREQATEEKIYQLHSPDILHIATHGYWSEIKHATTDGYRVFNAMVNSGLLLTGVVNYYASKQFPDTYDGILTAYEAQGLDLENTSLVILSACETSLGHLDAGEGVYGLQRAFRTAGAKSIMTSLWKVDDEATKSFMIYFYQYYLQTNDKFEAFRKAQRSLKEKFPDPYYWGAFVLTGS